MIKTENLANLIREIRRIHCSKDLHNLDDISKITDLHLAYFESALKRKEMYPSSIFADGLLNLVMGIATHCPNIRINLNYQSPYNDEFTASFYFEFNLSQKDPRDVDRFVEKSSTAIIDQTEGFEALKEEVYESTPFNVMPNKFFDISNPLLYSRFVIGNAYHNGKLNYDIYDLDVQYHKENDDSVVSLKKTRNIDFKTLDDAMYHINQTTDGIETIVVIKNLGSYPLNQTLIPLMVEKYIAKHKSFNA